MIPTFNCAELAVEAIQSVVDQLGGRDMEIIVVDDASTDAIGEAVGAFGDKVQFHRQRKNLGVPANLTACIQLARGEIVHILHGDDRVMPGYYDAMDLAFQDPVIAAAFTQSVYIDAAGTQLGIEPSNIPSGVVEDAACLLAAEQRVMTPSICVRRKAYEQVGGFHPELRCAEDWEMWVRIAANFPICHLAQPLAVYRMHDDSNTGRHCSGGAEARYNRRAIELNAMHLVPSRRQAVKRKAMRTYAISAARQVGSTMRRAGWRAALDQVSGALSLSTAPAVWGAFITGFVKTGPRKVS
jgi:glycosyltransferase involved in cell wall biosynthesis